MKRDFTFSTYTLLIQTLKKKGYIFLNFSDYLGNNPRDGE